MFDLDEGVNSSDIDLFEEPPFCKKYWKETIIFSITMLIILVRIFFYTGFIVRGDSMSPALENWELTIIQKGISEDSLDYGDIIIFKYKGDNYIKRIIAKGGDTVEIIGDKVFVNGEYTKEEYLNLDFLFTLKDMDKLTVPEGEYFIMGDNRGISNDSRNGLGTIKEDSIIGKMIWSAKIPLSFK